MRYLPKWSKPRYLKTKSIQVPQKVAAVLVKHLLLGICILVHFCTGCGTSKIYLCLEDSRSSFSQMSLKSKTKEARPLLLFLGKCDLIKQLKMSKFICDVKQLKMNTFVKSISNWLLVPRMIHLR